MLIVLNDLIADVSLRIRAFPIHASDLAPLTAVEIGPGGAANIAIMAARFGLTVKCLGEVGDDSFGKVVLEGLRREGVDVSDVWISPDSRTPVAGVLVDDDAEPAYLGYPGRLILESLVSSWSDHIRNASALFVDGWAENTGVVNVALQGMRAADAAGVPIFFDPGPGNPAISNSWHAEAAMLASVLLANEAEITALTGEPDSLTAARSLITSGCEWVIVKRGAIGCTLCQREGCIASPGFEVEVVDKTGAGDSLAGAIIYSYLHKLPWKQVGILANATGAAKVRKMGTGHNMPTLADIAAILSPDVRHVLPTQPSAPDSTGTG